LSYKTEWIDSEKLFNNELLRIGGINDLRGFDEESIFTSYYWISTFEYRFLLDRNSFFRLFYDQAYYVNKVLNTKDYPFGIGAGVQIQTIAGMLQLNYALGAQANSGINFQTGKVHFGIINYF
jgi:outer membrane protein assembly factor BamA